jgi:hypothetical protein
VICVEQTRCRGRWGGMVGGASGRGCGGRSLWTKEGRGGGQGGGTDEPLHPAPNAPAPTHTQEGDPEGWWEESFNGHSDSKPRGPQAISLDLAFPGAQHVYGLPERATNLALGATKGECGARAPGRACPCLMLDGAGLQGLPAHLVWLWGYACIC